MKKAKKKESKVKYGTISLPLPLIEKIQRRIKGTGMPSVSAYVSFVLRQILSSINILAYRKDIYFSDIFSVLYCFFYLHAKKP